MDKLLSAPNIEYLIEVAPERGHINLIFRDKPAGLHIEFKLSADVASKLSHDLGGLAAMVAAIQPALKVIDAQEAAAKAKREKRKARA